VEGGIIVDDAGTWAHDLWHGTDSMPGLEDVLVAIFAVVGALAVGYSIFLGVMLAKAEDEGKRKQAKSRIFKALAGLFIIVILFSTMTVKDSYGETFLTRILVGTTDRNLYMLTPADFLLREVSGGQSAELSLSKNHHENGSPESFGFKLSSTTSGLTLSENRITVSAPGNYTVRFYRIIEGAKDEHLGNFTVTVSQNPPPPRPSERQPGIPPEEEDEEEEKERIGNGDNELTQNSNTDIVDAWLRSHGDNWHFDGWPWPSGFGVGRRGKEDLEYQWRGMVKKDPFSFKQLRTIDLDRWAHIVAMENRENAQWQHGPIQNPPSTGYNNAFLSQLGIASSGLKLFGRHGGFNTMTGHLTSGYYYRFPRGTSGDNVASIAQRHGGIPGLWTRRAIKAAVYGWDPIYGFSDMGTTNSSHDTGRRSARPVPHGMIHIASPPGTRQVGKTFMALNGGYGRWVSGGWVPWSDPFHGERWWPAV